MVEKTFMFGDVVKYSILKYTGEVTKVHFKNGLIDMIEVYVLRSENRDIIEHQKKIIQRKNFDYLTIIPSDTANNLNYKDQEQLDKLMNVFTERAIAKEREFKIDQALINKDKALFMELTGGETNEVN